MSFTLVTGGSKNLGREICLAIAKQRGNVAIHYNKSKKEALQVVTECKSFGVQAEAIQGDFSTSESTKVFIENYKKQFIVTKNLVNNVGNYLIKNLLETSVEEMKDLYQVNLFAPFVLMQSFIPLIKQEKGSIVNIGVAGIEHARAENYSTAYSMTKLSLLMLTKTIAKELAAFDVAVNMVSPGILEGSIGIPKDYKSIPMKRFGTYNDIANVITFLLDHNNHYITGQNIEVAGGVRL
jgi:NAD(P)-dependent dehydrogenase (short-subunit alcohol dehydrogenase family)